jgi:hypothetical protein
MNFEQILERDETISWQGRPAPRCYTFRNWQHSLFGAIILIASFCWLLYGVKLGNEYQQALYGWIPVPFLLVGMYLSFGHLILSRLEWEHVFYALTNRRLLAVKGLLKRRIESLSIDDVIWFQLSPHGEQLGTVRIRFRDLEQKMVVSCVEYPRKLTDLLEAAMEKNGIDITAKPEE